MRKLIILAVVGIGAVVAGVVAYRRATGGDRLREEIAAYAAFDTPLPGDLFVADAGCGRVSAAISAWLTFHIVSAGFAATLRMVVTDGT